MSSDWKKTTIDEACARVYSGGTPSTKEPAYWNGDMNWLSSGETRNKFIYETERKITKLGVEQSSTQLAFKDSIVIATAGQGYTRGQASFLKIDTYVNQSVLVLEADRTMVEPLFLYYNLSNRYEELRQLSDGTSTRGGLSGWIVRRMAINLPPIDIQKKIVDVLYAIDQKIECNIAINKNLEEQARAIFDSFYLKSEDKVPFTQMIKVLGGGTPKTTERAFWCGQIPFFTPKDVGNPYVLETEKYVTELGLTNCNSRLYPVNTTFVTARGTVGKVSLAGIPMAMNQSCYALMSDALHPFMTYFYTLHTVKTLQHKATGAVFDAIVTSDFDSELLHRIPEDDALQLLRRISPMMENIRVNVIGNLRLTELRDALLPRLMSGEIDVSNITL